MAIINSSYKEVLSKNFAGDVKIRTPGVPFKGKLAAILDLHGAGERGHGVLSRTFLDAVFDYYDEKGQLFPFISITPRCVDGDIWNPHQLFAITNHAINNFAIDARRVSVIGYSMGARGVWDLICEYPDVYSCAVPISGFACYLRSPKIAHIPIRAYHGTRDSIVPNIEAIKMVNSAREEGGQYSKVSFYNIPDRGHDIFQDVYYQEDLYAWMKNQNTELNKIRKEKMQSIVSV